MQTLAGLPTIQGYPGKLMIDYDQVAFEGLAGEVTREDIELGIPEKCGACPVARAISRMFPDCKVNIDYHIIILNRGCLAFTKHFSVSRALRVWIGDYDAFWERHSKRVGNPVKLVIRKDYQHNRDFMFDIKADD